jgi:NADPH2 dehydrogenase
VNITDIVRLGGLRDVARFQEHLKSLGLTIPCDRELMRSSESPLCQPINRNGFKIGNRFAIHPMEGWDGTPDGNPTEHTIRRWKRFGSSGAKLIWGGEAVAVCHSGRANPNQLLLAEHTRAGLARLREALIEEHRRVTGSLDGLFVGLQLTHSGRYSRPNEKDRPEPRVVYRHPILDCRAMAKSKASLQSSARRRASRKK